MAPGDSAGIKKPASAGFFMPAESVRIGTQLYRRNAWKK
jgi:hypothetical protein